MSVNGVIKNGAIVLPPGTSLPEGASVRVETLLTAAEGPLVAAVEKLAKPRLHLPADFALNHGYYLGGVARGGGINHRWTGIDTDKKG